MIEILTEFASGRKVVYTYEIFELLMSDESVVKISELKSGKCLYEKEDSK